MFSVKLLPSTAVQYLKCSSPCGIPLLQHFCFVKTESFVRKKKLPDRSSIIERKSFDRGNSIVERKSQPRKQKQRKVLPPIVKSNRGVGRRLAAIAEETGSNHFDGSDFSENLEEFSEDFDDERNFFNASEDFDEIEREKLKHRRKLAYQITKRKFFKPPKEPNLLTYAEKQHIKFLHEDEHQQWTIESLAESFPATPEVIAKIVKSKVKFHSANDIIKHDSQVQKNWQALKKGELQISSEALKEHVKRFLDRDIKTPSPAEAEKYVKKPEKKPRKIYEFSQIIESYRAVNAANASERTSLIGKSIIEDEEEKSKKSEPADNYHSKQSGPELKDGGDVRQGRIDETARTNRTAKHFTLDELRKTLEADSMWKKEIDDLDKEIISSTRRSRSKELSDSANEIHGDGEICLSLSTAGKCNEIYDKSMKTKKRSTEDELTQVRKMDNKLVSKLYDKDLADELKIAEYISIPKNLRKEGCLYKVKDCFYAHDGQFLYRVPGLKS